MTLSGRKKLIFSSVLLVLLAGCNMESTSYWIGTEQSLTLIRTKPYPWSNELLRTITIMSQPDCTRRYPLPPDGGAAGNLKLYKAAGDGYVMQDGIGQYRIDMAGCGMRVEGKSSVPGELLGDFAPVPEGGIQFVPASGAQKK